MRAVLVPVKAFHKAKLRLADALQPSERQELARALAGRVVAAAAGLSTYVVCDDEQVATWAGEHGAEVLWTPGLGLSGAVGAGVSRLAALGFDLAVVAHADLPLVRSLHGIGVEGVVTLAPDRHLTGTNVCCVPTGAGFRFAYGIDSFPRHLAEARRLGLPTHLVYDWALANDLDVPDDLALLTRPKGGS